MRASLFVTCLVDQFHPEVAVGMLRVLRRAGVTCDFPPAQTCCGQPAFNSGCPDEARVAARQFLRAFRDTEYVVAPSGSCVAMARVFLPGLFVPDTAEHRASVALAKRVYEFSEFLVDVLGVSEVGARFPHRVTYHDSCHLLRELNVRHQPRRLLAAVRDIELVELTASEACCGFGGTFSVKYPEISTSMAEDKVRHLHESGAEYLVANDTGCLMHLRGLLSRRGVHIRAVHLAEVLAAGSDSSV